MEDGAKPVIEKDQNYGGRRAVFNPFYGQTIPVFLGRQVIPNPSEYFENYSKLNWW